MQRHAPLVNDEMYHVFNRGAHKSKIFTSERDYERFLLLLFLCNTTKSISVRDVLTKYRGRSSVEIYSGESSQEERPVGILAYSLMPNHFHLVLRQQRDNGITQFMKRLCTAYSMYYNLKHEHSGVLFQGRFKSNHVDTEAYFRHIFAYVHLNAVELVEKEWEEKGVRNAGRIRAFLNQYRYSSFYDYSVAKRPQSTILTIENIPDFLTDENDLEDLLADFTRYTKDEEPDTTPEDGPRERASK